MTTTSAKPVMTIAFSTGLFLGMGLVTAGLLLDDMLPALTAGVRAFVIVCVSIGVTAASWRILRKAYRRARLAEADALEGDCPRDEDGTYRDGWIACARAGRGQAH